MLYFIVYDVRPLVLDHSLVGVVLWRQEVVNVRRVLVVVGSASLRYLAARRPYAA